MNTFKLSISTYNSVVYNGYAAYCGIMTLDGSLGLKAQHEPILSVLKENSVISYKNKSGQDKSFKIISGILSFHNNHCEIIVNLGEKEKS